MLLDRFSLDKLAPPPLTRLDIFQVGLLLGRKMLKCVRLVELLKTVRVPMIANDEKLFHYTDLGAIASIVKSRKLWLTNISYLNDTDEMKNGARCLLNQYNKLAAEEDQPPERAFATGFLAVALARMNAQEADHSVFTCSFSRAPNLLSQWRGYGNFAVEFSRAQLEKKHRLLDCVYSDVKKRAEAKKVVSNLVAAFNDVATNGTTMEKAGEAADELSVSAGRFKNKHFSAEKEVRLVVAGAHECSEVMYRSRGEYLVPYLEVEVSPESIAAIHIGPIADQALAERSIKSLLRSCGYIGIQVVKSDIPYRA